MAQARSPSEKSWPGWDQLSPVLLGANFWDGPPGSQVGPRYIEEFQFIFVQAGMAEAYVDSQTRLIRPGDLMFYGPNVRHGFTALGPGPLRLVGLRLVMRQSDLTLLPTGRHTSPTPFVYAGDKPACPLCPLPEAFITSPPGSPIRRLCESLVLSWLADEGGRPMEKRGLLLQLLEAVWDVRVNRAGAAGLPEHQRLAIDRAQRAILGALIDPPSLAELAAQAGWSVDHFSRLFRKQTGLTYPGYVRHHRLLESRRLLIEGRLTVGQVAHAVGFADPLYFSRAFARAFKASPSELRRHRRIV